MARKLGELKVSAKVWLFPMVVRDGKPKLSKNPYTILINLSLNVDESPKPVMDTINMNATTV